MFQKEVILIGRINKGRLPIGGETGKNQALLKGLSPFCKVFALDFYKNKQRPWIFLQTIWTLITKPKTCLILSTTASNIIPLIKLLQWFKTDRTIIHWCIGGKFAEHIENKNIPANIFQNLSVNIVESQFMKDSLIKNGISNTIYLPNFKTIDYLPDIKKRFSHSKNRTSIHFVYLSRIMRDKGVDTIIDATNILNKSGNEKKFDITFYGIIDQEFKKIFFNRIEKIPNIRYEGVLNLQTKEGYNTLANYDCMLFPTYHSSEGFAGVFIDAFIAGLPVITTQWHVNPEIITDGFNGIIINPQSKTELVSAMERVIKKEIDIEQLSRNAQLCSDKYDVNKVLNQDLLQRLNII